MTLPGRSWHFSGDQGALAYPARSVRGQAGARPACENKCADGGGLAGADFDHQPSGGVKQRRDRGGDRAVTVEPIVPAVERRPRIVVANVGRERGNLARCDIGRVGDDQIERPAERSGQVAGDERRAFKPQTPGIVARDPQRAEARVGADAERVRQFREQRQEDCARSGAKIRNRACGRVRDPAESISASAASTIVSVSGRGTSVVELIGELQAPEFLKADDARDRFTPEPPLGKAADQVPFASIETACARRR